MVTVLIVMIIVAFIAFMAGVVMAVVSDEGGPTARTIIGLHQVRRDLETGIIRAQMKGDAARIRRELDEELQDKL